VKRRLAALAFVFGSGACGSGGGFIDAPQPPPQPDPGTLSVTWKLTDANGNAMMCSQVNATTVVVDPKDSTTGSSFSASFACGLGEAISGSLPAATYDIRFYLTNSQGQLASATAQMGVVIQPDMTTKLMPVTFIVF
jgi:hypothetical protein